MSQFRRRLMGVRNMPYDAEVEYLKGTGTQWLDTGIVGSMDIDFEIQFKRDGTNTYYNILGDRYSASSRLYSLILAQSGNNGGYFTVGDSANLIYIPKSYRTTNVVTYRKTGLDLYIGSTKVSTFPATTADTTPYTIVLFGCRSNGEIASTYNFDGRFYYCKLYDNGTLVRDMIPVRVGTVGYMYDKVSKQLFGNAGEGSFVLGPDV